MPINLFDLPLEIRDAIYRYLCRDAIVVQVQKHAPGTSAAFFDPHKKLDFELPFRSLLLVNRQMNREFTDVLWKNLHLDLRALDTMSLVCDFGERYPSLVRNVRTVTCHMGFPSAVDLWTGDLNTLFGDYEYELEQLYASTETRHFKAPRLPNMDSQLPLVPFHGGGILGGYAIQNMVGTRITLVLSMPRDIRSFAGHDYSTTNHAQGEPIKVAYVEVSLNESHTKASLNYWDDPSALPVDAGDPSEKPAYVSTPLLDTQQEEGLQFNISQLLGLSKPSQVQWKHFGQPELQAAIEKWRALT